MGNEYGGGCRANVPFQTNVRANASYTIPRVDVLLGVVFQYRPGAERTATLTFANTDVVWEPPARTVPAPSSSTPAPPRRRRRPSICWTTAISTAKGCG